MHFNSLNPKEFHPDQIARFIEMFERQGWSGPHTSEGRLLSHALNYCVEQGIPYTLMFVPKAGYYVKRAYPDNFVPADIVDNFKQELQAVRDSTGEPLDEDVYGMLYDMEKAPNVTTPAKHFATVIEIAMGDEVQMEVGEDFVSSTRKPEA